MKIKVNDQVLLIAGKYKGKTGKVMRTYAKHNKIVVEKVNIRTRHIRRTPNRAGQMIKYEAPLAVSNVMLLCPHCKKAVRVGYSIPKKVQSDSAAARAAKKYRVCKKCGESVEPMVTKAEKKR